MTLRTRLSKLETVCSPPANNRPGHRVIGNTEAECEARRREMIESGQALETDIFAFRIMVDPKDPT
jgi:hypothetical protein